MTSRQKRELLALIVVIILGALAGYGYNLWTQGKLAKAPAPSDKARNFVHPGKSAEGSALEVKPLDEEKVCAKVGGEEVRGELVNKYVQFTLAAMAIPKEALSKEEFLSFRARVFDQIVDDFIVSNYAKENQVTVSDAEINDFLADARNSFPSEEEFSKDIEESFQMSLDEFKEFSRKFLLRKKVAKALKLDARVSDEELEREYERLKEMMKSHPGGKVELPSKEEFRKNLEERKRTFALEMWLQQRRKNVKVEIYEESLKAPPIPKAEGVPNPHKGLDLPK